MDGIQGLFFSDFKNAYIPHILKEMYIDRVYDSFFEGKDNLTILDVGANVGIFSFYAYQYASKIIAIEPSKQHFATMNHMFNFNKMNKVIPLNVALSDKNGKGILHHHENVTMYSLREEVQSPNLDAEEVDMKTINVILDENGIDKVDFLKLDVEGSELDIVCSSSFEKAVPKIDAIFGEFHVWSGRNPEQLRTVLEDYGYDFNWIPTDAQVFSAVKRK